jgi:addiction module HigA family antidote
MIEPITYPYQPDFVTPPGETLLETIETLGITQTDLAQRMGRPEKTVSEIIHTKVEITPETALQLERVLNIPARFWLNLEQNYRAAIARQNERERLQNMPDWLRQVPVAEMAERGWINRVDDQVEQARIVLNFFGVASPQQWNERWLAPTVNYRQSQAFASDPGAVAAWLRWGEIQAQKRSCLPYQAEAFRFALQQIRNLTTEPSEIFEPELIKLCEQAGVAVVLTPPLAKMRISGVTYWLTPHKAVIQLTLRYKTNDHFWFSFFHEAGHILKHGKREMFWENHADIEPDEALLAKEEEANAFARDFLIVPTTYRELTTKAPYISKENIRTFANKIGIAPGIVVGRLQHDGHLPATHCNDLKIKFEWTKEEA